MSTYDKKSILLVEDEAIIALSEKIQLEKYGYSVHHVTTGEKAVSTITREDRPIDLVLMDIDLGSGIDGTQAADQILNYKDIPVVFLSSHTEPEVVEKTEKITSYGYVVKNSKSVVLDASIKMALKLFNEKMDHQQAEEALKESEAKFRSIVENGSPIIFTIDKQGKFLLSEGKSLKALGLEPGQVVGMSAFDIYKDYPAILKGINEALAGRTTHDVVRVGEVSFDVFYTPNKDEMGDFKSITGMAIDITERKQAEKKLEESEEYYRTLIENSIDSILVMDSKGNKLYQSKSNASIMGYKIGERIEKNVLSILHPDDKERIIKQLAIAIPKHNIIEKIHFRALHKDGSYRHIEGTAKNMLHSPAVKGIVLNYRDITERKQAEEKLQKSETKFRQLAETTSVMIIIYQNDYFTYANPAAEMITGYRLDELKQMKFWEIVSPEYIDLVKERGQARQVGESVPSGYEFKIISKQGEEKWVFLTGNTIEVNSGKAGLISAINISEYKLAKEELTKLSTAVTQSPSVIAITDTEGNLEYGNPKFTELTGYTLEEAKGKNPRILKSGELTDEIYKELWDTISSGKTWRGEFHNKKKNGKLFWEMASISPIFDKQGKIVSYVKVAEDITERKQAEEALKESELRLKSLINATPDIICFKDGKGRWLIANDADLELFNLQNTDYFGKTDAELAEFTDPIYKEDFLLCMETDEKAWQLKTLSRSNEVIPTVNGTKKVYDVIKVPLFKPDGARKGLVVLGADITNRKQAEEEITKLSTAVAQSPSVIAITDTDGNLEYGNPRFMELTGYTFEEVKGKTLRILKSGELTDGIYKELWETISSGKTWRGEFHNKKKNGELFWEMASISPIFDKQGKIVSYVKIAEDITERKQTEEKLRESEALLIRSQQIAHVGSWKLDVSTNRLDWSDEVYRIFGCEPQEFGASYEAFLSFIHPDDLDLVNEAYTNSLHEKRDSYEIVHRIIRKSTGEVRFVHERSTHERDATGAVIHSIGMVQDITVRKQVEEEIKKQLEEKETLLREVHHRIKNNMANVEGLLSLQADSIDNPEAKAALQDSMARVQSIRILYEKLLLGKEYNDISIKSYVEGLLDSISAVYITGNDVTIQKQLTDFTIDSKKAISLGIIINELLTNVFKYAFKGCENGTVSILIEKTENFATLIIQDNGIGIDEKTNLNKSSGLGLTLVKMLVEQLGGTYSIVNENGTKNTVQFEI